MSRRNMTDEVAAAVIQRGTASLDDLEVIFPNFTRYQLGRALQNANAKGLIKCLHKGNRQSGRGCAPGVWGPMDAPSSVVPSYVRVARRIVCNIFDPDGVIAPREHGKKHSPLGVWE